LGIDDNITHTLQQTGDLFGITRERARQIETMTLFKMGIVEKPKFYCYNFYVRNNLTPEVVKEILYKKLELKPKIDLDSINITQETGMKNGGRDRYRELVRKRDKHTCQWCGIKRRMGRRMDVHHIDGTPEDTQKCDANFDNQITLCHKCHLNIDGCKMPGFNNRKGIVDKY
jgi:hypothetical protein